jgi:hypothetical protein
VIDLEERNLGTAGVFLAWNSYFLLFLFMAFPMVSKLFYVKPLAFAFVLFAVVLEFLTTGYSRLEPRIGQWTFGLALLSFFFVIEGFFRGTPGASKMALVYVIWPIAYLIWIAGLAHWRLLKGLHHIALLSTIFIGLYGCAYLLTQLNFIPQTSLITALSMGWESESFGAHEGFTQMQFPGLNSLPFLLPYVMATIAIQRPMERRSVIKQIYLWAACILGLAVTIIGTRRALLLVVLLSPLLTLFFRSFQPQNERMQNKKSFTAFLVILFIGAIFVFVSLNFIYQFDVISMFSRFVTGFDISSQSPEENTAVRHEQLVALIRGWQEHPFFGAGHGATAAGFGSIRSQEMPWSYELGYLALLFQIGLIGVAAYAAGTIWVFRQGTALIREGNESAQMMVPMLVGFCSALIAHATNPYLDRVDGMWMFFLPLALINRRLVTQVQWSFRRSSLQTAEGSVL